MKNQSRWIHIALALLTLSTINFQLSTLHAQGTAFTYQGRLNNGTNPATGLYDFRFRLAADSLGNTYVGSSVLTNAVGVTNGLFTVAIDFGANFPGANRWLEVDVRTNGAASYTTLNPLQALTPTPYAIYAEGAGVSSSVSSAAITASGLNTVGAPSSGQVLSYNGSAMSWITPSFTLPYSGSAASSGSLFTLQNTGSGPAGAFLGNVGIGTTTPSNPLTVAGFAEMDGGVTMKRNSANPAVYIDQDGSGPIAWFQHASNTVLTINNSGNVGIGTSNAFSPLTVNGDIRMQGEDRLILASNGGQDIPYATVASVDEGPQHVGIAFNTTANAGTTMPEAMRISSSGNVGIGTTNPTDSLDVYGSFFLSDLDGTGVYGYGGKVTISDAEFDSIAVGYPAPGVWLIAQEGAFLGPGSAVVLEPTGRVDVYTTADQSSGMYMAAGSSGWSAISDRNSKENFVPTKPEEVLNHLAAIPISTWNYKTQDKAIRHLGPMAQDFHAAFAVGEDDKHINEIDEQGVALAAIQGLNQKLEETRAQNLKLKQENESLVERLDELEAAVRSLAKKK